MTANCGGYLVVMRNYVWDATETPATLYFDLLIEPLIPWSNESFIQSFSQCVFPKFDSRVENVRRSVSSETLAKKVKEAISL